MTVLVECTHVFFNPLVNSGIQRVVKNIVRNLPEDSAEVIPVVLRGGEVFRALSLDAEIIEGKLLPWAYRFERFGDRFRIKSGVSPSGESAVFMRRWVSHGFSSVMSRIFHALANSILLLSSFFGVQQRSSTVSVGAGDVLILLDSSWSEGFFSKVEELVQRGVKVVPVIYDVIPVVHPEFHDERMVDIFTKWLSWTFKISSGYMAISASVAEELRAVLCNLYSEEQVERLWFSNFTLGSDLKSSLSDGEVRDEVKALFIHDTPIYLSVSTIEPRKNHEFQLDAFDQLWADGLNVCLCIVGRVGWKTDAFMGRVHRHPEFGQRLFVFHDLGDHELIYCYKRSKTLLFTSFAEGFGLPLVEASHYQLPVICSDIPVFREVGGESFRYCDLSDVSSLVALIQQQELCSQAESAPVGHCLSWRESSVELLANLSLSMYCEDT